MAYTQVSGRQSYCEDQNLTGSAPTTATDGVPVQDLDAVTVTVAANSGQTLSGAGTLACYVYDPLIAAWSRMPENDLSVGTASVRYLSFAPFAVTAPTGSRIQFVPVGVTVSSGTTVRVHLSGYCARVRGL